MKQDLLLAYYGDDFTGSTDMLDALHSAGIETVLFLAPPPADARAQFPTARCFGLAGTARSRDSAWMARELPAAFNSLARLGAPILQYKVCSTFDSSPAIGSIGRAIDIGVKCMPGRWSPMVVAAPRLGRYQAFGNLFALANGHAHRLDRHPTMARHPVTPMDEADLRHHLARQTSRRIELIDLLALCSGHARERAAALQGDDVPVVLFDALDDDTLAEAGRVIWEQRGDGVFSASSSGLAYALVAHWRRAGMLAEPAPASPLRNVERIAVVSGSCSPVTAAQIAWAAAHGFALERLDIARVLDAKTQAVEVERVVAAAVTALRAGRSALIYSAAGPDDAAVRSFDDHAAHAGLTRDEAARRVGDALAAVLPRLLDAVPLQRVAVAGGDSAGAVAQALAIDTLTVAAPLVPGAPLCRAGSRQAARDGLEIVLKGGQMGAPDFFGRVIGPSTLTATSRGTP
jgi:3-oxoisoapionate kinase